MSAIPETAEEYCPSCGFWVSYLNFDYDTGWCRPCTGSTNLQPQCTQCGTVLQEGHGRTTCPSCRQENWLAKHADEIEYLVVVKGYTVSYARQLLIELSRPICQCCGKPIKGAAAVGRWGETLFCRKTKACRSAYPRYRKLLSQNLTTEQALAIIRRG